MTKNELIRASLEVRRRIKENIGVRSQKAPGNFYPALAGRAGLEPAPT